MPEQLRADVIKAALHLVATEWDNGRTSADASADLDHAQDRLDDALTAYVAAANAQVKPTPEQLRKAGQQQYAPAVAMEPQQINDIRDQLIKAVERLDTVNTAGPVDDEVGVFGVEFTNGDEVFVTVVPA